ncbi:MAG: Peptidase M20D, amidohydrolase, partial [uncultured Sphingomonadaceae bacterium]
ETARRSPRRQAPRRARVGATPRGRGEGHALAARPLPRPARQSRTVDAGDAHRGEAGGGGQEAWVPGDDRRRQDGSGRGDEERTRSRADAARRHGRAAGRRADRAALCEQGHCEEHVGGDQRRDARVRARHAHGGVGRRGAAALGDQGPLVGNAGDDRPAGRGDERGCQGDAGGRALHALSQADSRDRIPRRGGAARGDDRLLARLRAGERRYRGHRGAGRRRARRLPAHDQGPDRAGRAHRGRAADAGLARERPAVARGGHRRKLPGGDQAQHHLRQRQ